MTERKMEDIIAEVEHSLAVEHMTDLYRYFGHGNLRFTLLDATASPWVSYVPRRPPSYLVVSDGRMEISAVTIDFDEANAGTVGVPIFLRPSS